ncbi:outer membrane beta-barrel protein [Bradyrhizobium sediminis]|uniref:Outer membrane beta-barrel protein n=1 Tax=Bradyrhizobium sediminis TaxID=2840469 RepID=A0A975RRP2_9BRAD|nr:outer membrane beta-barrel protein [Bradyrhizobium sediminis]QWG17098.1 outer membrane beta-barrel protein [Bradyrhizobium sediminis]
MATASTVVLAGVTNAQAAGAPPVSWTGFYVGANIGGAFHEATTTDLNGWGSSGTPYVSPWFNSNKATASFGGQAGYNWQINRFVFGVETDLNYIGSSSTFTPPNTLAINCGPACRVSATNDLTWLSTYRGRVGIAFDQIMIFGTAGLAVGQVDNHWGWGDARFSDSQFSTSGTKAGYVFGGGIELMLMSKWTVRAEAMHVDLGTSRSTITSQPFCCGPAGTFTTEFKNTANIGRLALSYRW